MEAVAARISKLRPDVPVACAYLELDEPDLATAAQQLVGQGATAISIVPMFLGTGRHAREDLPALVESLRQQHPDVAFTLQQAVGEDPRVLDLLASIALG